MLAFKRTIHPALPFAAVFALLSFGTGCKQPGTNCTTAHGAFGAVYKLKKGDESMPCAQLKGEVLGMNTYFATGGINGTPRFDQPTAAIRSESLGLLIEYAVEREVVALDDVETANALGDFSSGLPEGDFCEVPKFDKVEVSLPEVPEVPAVMDDPMTPDVDETAEALPGQAATTVVYQWSNARFYMTTNAQGTQFTADLKYTQDGCTAEYEVTGMFPAVGCEKDEDCTDPESTINPDFAVECDKGLGFCVLAEKELPSLE